jgi:DNA polymerase III delta prime subunit
MMGAMNMRENFLWVEKFRPKTIADTILPTELKATFQQFVDQKNIPNLILSGSAGVGKTTVARAMLEEAGSDYIIINGSMNGNIDTLRNEILNFASAVSFTGNRKYVILDEADYLNPNSTQPALRNFMEEFSKNCGFVMTCNFKNKIIEPLHSRCSVIDFKIGKKDMAALAAQFMKRVCMILTSEKVEFEKQVVAQVIQKYFPDWRRVLNELQRYSATGKIDTGILTNFEEANLGKLLEFMKAKDFTSVRKWVGENSDSQQEIFRKIYDTCADYMSKNTIPAAVLILAKYQYQAAFAADAEINLTACIAELLLECEWK